MILQTADLEQVTMKTVRRQINAMYPNHDLSEKRDFIKATVKEVNLPPPLNRLHSLRLNLNVQRIEIVLSIVQCLKLQLQIMSVSDA